MRVIYYKTIYPGLICSFIHHRTYCLYIRHQNIKLPKEWETKTQLRLSGFSSVHFVLLTVNDSDSHKTFSVKVICSFLETDCPLTEMSNPAAATPTRCQASAREHQQQLNIQNSKYKYQHQHVWVWMRFRGDRAGTTSWFEKDWLKIKVRSVPGRQTLFCRESSGTIVSCLLWSRRLSSQNPPHCMESQFHPPSYRLHLPKLLSHNRLPPERATVYDTEVHVS